MSSGERPIGAAKGKQSDTEALCHPPPPPVPHLTPTPLLHSNACLPTGWAGVQLPNPHLLSTLRPSQHEVIGPTGILIQATQGPSRPGGPGQCHLAETFRPPLSQRGDPETAGVV